MVLLEDMERGAKLSVLSFLGRLRFLRTEALGASAQAWQAVVVTETLIELFKLPGCAEPNRLEHLEEEGRIKAASQLVCGR
jgi:hypothetical protein